MNTAIISTVTTSSINTFALSTSALYFSSLILPDFTLRNSTQNLYVRSNALFFGSNRELFQVAWGNAWGGAKTAYPLPVPSFPLNPNFLGTYEAQYQVVSRAAATGGTITTVTIGATTYTVHNFPSSATPYTFTITRPGYMEFLFVGPGGNGGSSGNNTALAVGGGGGGGGFVIYNAGQSSGPFGYGNSYVLNGWGVYCRAGTYTMNNIPGPGGSAGVVEQTIVDPASGAPTNWLAVGGCNGETSPSINIGQGGGLGGFGGYGVGTIGLGGNALSFGGGGGGASGSFSAPVDVGNGGVGSGTSSGGKGNSGVSVVRFDTNGTIGVSAGGGGGAGGGAGSVGGAGGSVSGSVSGGNGGAINTAGGNTVLIGCGGGGAGGQNPIGVGVIAGGTGGAGLCQVRYTFFSTVLLANNYPGY